MPGSPARLDANVLRRTGAQSRLLVLLHGYGEPSASLTDRLDLLDPDGQWLVAVPNAPFEHRGKSIWHRPLTAPGLAAQQFAASIVALDELLGRLEHDEGLPAAAAVVGGFSQGGGLGLAMLLAAGLEHRPAAGFGICSFAPAFTGFRADRAAAAGRPAFLVSATKDHFAPIEASRASAAVLCANGIELTYDELDGEHVMTDDAAALVGEWLRAIALGLEPPVGASHLLGSAPSSSFYEGLWEHVS